MFESMCTMHTYFENSETQFLIICKSMIALLWVFLQLSDLWFYGFPALTLIFCSIPTNENIIFKNKTSTTSSKVFGWLKIEFWVCFFIIFVELLSFSSPIGENARIFQWPCTNLEKRPVFENKRCTCSLN